MVVRYFSFQTSVQSYFYLQPGFINYFVFTKIHLNCVYILRMLIIFKFIRGTGIKVLRKLLILFLMF